MVPLSRVAFGFSTLPSFRLTGRSRSQLLADDGRCFSLSVLNSSSDNAVVLSSSEPAKSWWCSWWFNGDADNFALDPPLHVDFILKSIGPSCAFGRCDDDDDEDNAAAAAATAAAAAIDDAAELDDVVVATAVAVDELVLRNVDVAGTCEFEWRLMVAVLCMGKVGFGDVGGVIDTTISSLSMSSSFSLLVDAFSVGEHCDFKTASNMYRFVSSSADLLPECAQMGVRVQFFF